MKAKDFNNNIVDSYERKLNKLYDKMSSGANSLDGKLSSNPI